MAWVRWLCLVVGLLVLGVVGSAWGFGVTRSGFGFAGFDVGLTSVDGSPDTQAGSHPDALSVSFALNSKPVGGGGIFPIGGQAKNFEVDLPPGLVGDPGAVAQCTRVQLDAGVHNTTASLCPAASQVGVAHVSFGFIEDAVFAVFNIVPPAGVPAQFGFVYQGVPVFIDAGVRSGSDYGVTAHVDNVPQREVYASSVTIWGVPGAADHDFEREGAGCGQMGFCSLSGAVAKPFLTLPSECSGPLTFSIVSRTWEEPLETAQASVQTPALRGCESLAFNPSISAAPDTGQADTPAGLTVDVALPQEGLETVGGLVPSAIKNTLVTLPQGLVINPGQAAGLEACQESEAHIYIEDQAPSCPLASKVGTDEAEVPILRHNLKGNVYVLQSDPPHLRLLITAFGDGVEVKLVANVELDQSTGQLRTTLTNIPQAPVSDFKLAFSGGAQAALDTPTACGEYLTETDFTPWSTPLLGDAFPASAFLVTTGPKGASCPPSPLLFSPVLHAGSTTDQAGGFTDFSLLLQNSDDRQRIGALRFRTPPGLLGMISQVQPCPEPQASQGTCQATAEIGHAVVASGPGPYPLVIPEPGRPPARVYLTGPYQGAPFGLSIVTPVIAGPFDLGINIVRAKIEVDPHTAQITVTTDPTASPTGIPRILDGVPTDLRTINTIVDRPGFMFNPTNCSPFAFTGTASGSEGTQAPLEAHFQVGSCQSLAFKPDFKVQTTAKASRREGASLTATILYPNTPPANNQASTQANIQSVKVELPKQLPSRLTTLQKACLAAVFQTNPNNCPPASKIGYATVHTPVLPVPLTGPAYFVSHGGEAFPTLIIHLQGDNVTFDLEGTTFISKKGITSTTFKTVPDAPFTSFQLTLPQGPYSALAANGNLCNTPLKMPTHFTAQNGTETIQDTKITVTNCPKHKHHKHKHPKHHPHHHNSQKHKK